MGNTTSEITGPLKELIESKEPKAINDHVFWEKLFESTSDQQEKLGNGYYANQRGWPPASAVRHMKQECPKNLATLVRRSVLKLYNATKCKLKSGAGQVNVINTVRMLAMIIPIMFEDPAWDGFWTTPAPKGVVIVIPEETIATSKDPEPNMNLAQMLLSSLVDLCFVPSFTAPRGGKAENEARGYACVAEIQSEHFIWQKGIGRTSGPRIRNDVAMDCNQIDILQLLQVCCSKLMYSSAVDARPQEDMWLKMLTNGSIPKAMDLYKSMLNTVVGYDPLGWGMPLGSWFPDVYHHAVIEACGDIVSLMLDFRSVDDEGKIEKNEFADWLTKMSQVEDLDFITKGIGTMLNYPLEYPSVAFPAVHHSLIIMLWRLCDDNEDFIQRLLAQGTVLELLTPVLYHIHEHRLDFGQIGLVHIGVYVVLILSGRRNFAVRLNKEYVPKYKIPIPSFEGNHGDLLMLVIHALMTGPNANLQALYECLLTIVVNTSPYLKKTSLVAANKLVHLFEVFSSPRFLFASQDNHHLMFFLLEAFNNLIQYQFEGNQHLVYVIIRRRAVFTRLMGITSSPFVDVDEPEQSSSGADVVFDPNKAIKPTEIAAAPGVDRIVRSSLTQDSSTHEKEHFTVEKAKSEQGQTPSFLPTAEWLESWKSKLPLETIQRLLHVLVPQVEKLCSEKGVTDEADILKFLQNGTLVGLLPVPHPILIRRHHSVPSSTVWYYSYVLGAMYLRCMNPPVWHGTTVRLFRVKTSE